MEGCTETCEVEKWRRKAEEFQKRRKKSMESARWFYLADYNCLNEEDSQKVRGLEETTNRQQKEIYQLKACEVEKWRRKAEEFQKRHKKSMESARWFYLAYYNCLNEEDSQKVRGLEETTNRQQKEIYQLKANENLLKNELAGRQRLCYQFQRKLALSKMQAQSLQRKQRKTYCRALKMHAKQKKELWHKEHPVRDFDQIRSDIRQVDATLMSIKNDGEDATLMSIKNEGEDATFMSIKNEGEDATLMSIKDEGEDATFMSIKHEREDDNTLRVSGVNGETASQSQQHTIPHKRQQAGSKETADVLNAQGTKSKTLHAFCMQVSDRSSQIEVEQSLNEIVQPLNHVIEVGNGDSETLSSEIAEQHSGGNIEIQPDHCLKEQVRDKQETGDKRVLRLKTQPSPWAKGGKFSLTGDILKVSSRTMGKIRFQPRMSKRADGRKNQEYPCMVCRGFTGQRSAFKTGKSLEVHVKKIHQGAGYKSNACEKYGWCYSCGTQFSSLKQIVDHIRSTGH